MLNGEIVEIKNITKTYENGFKTIVLQDANFTARKKDFVGIFAPSGYGKSTLINLIAGLDKPDKGEVWVNGSKISDLNEKELALFRRKHIGIVFQFFNLFPTLTAIENVMLPMQLNKVPRKTAKQRALELLEIVGIRDKAYRFPSQLSGGEQQRVAIARALANDPLLLLLDEPTGNLDEKNAVLVFELLNELNREKGVTILVATHDVEHALKFVNKAVTIRDKKIVEYGDKR